VIWFCSRQHAVARLLIEYGVDVNLRATNGCGAFEVATFNGDTEMVQLIASTAMGKKNKTGILLYVYVNLMINHKLLQQQMTKRKAEVERSHYRRRDLDLKLESTIFYLSYSQLSLEIISVQLLYRTIEDDKDVVFVSIQIVYL